MRKNITHLSALLLALFLCVSVSAQQKGKSAKPSSAPSKTKGTEGKPKPEAPKEKEPEVATEVGIAEDVSILEVAPPAEASVPAVDEDRVYTVVEMPAEFPGGVSAMNLFLGNSLKYPKTAKKANVTGKVYAKFLVEKDGSISEVQVVKSLGHGCDEEAVRVIKSMPTWKPAHQRGKIVRSYYMLPVNFAPAN
jgi:protein TonB